MTMPQFFVTTELGGGTCSISGDDFTHLTRVRRVAVGDTLELRDANGDSLTGRIVEMFDTSMSIVIIDRRRGAKRSFSIILCAGILKGGKFDFVVQKAVEIGVSRIIPVMSSRTVPDIEGREYRKAERWRKIAIEASKQCMRGDLPTVESPVNFASILARDFPGAKLIAHTGFDCPPMKSFLRANSFRSAALLVGPEGGFTDREVSEASSRGWTPVRLGYTALRAETAALVLPAILAYEWSEYD